MTNVTAEILRSARVAELRAAAQEIAAACRPPAAITLPRSARSQRQRLILLLMRERQRNAKLVAQFLR